MLINFAFDLLGTTVTCDKVSTDGYECSNLLSSHFMTRKNGYIAEHFVKPPVHITFRFPCNVNISHISVDPFVGQQQSLQIDVLSASKPSARTSHGKSRQLQILDSPHIDESSLPAFFQVSRTTTSEKSRICFYSSRFNQGRRSNGSFLQNQIKTEMRHSKAEILTCASHVVLKIARTRNGSTPALSNVEIWGCVSSSVCRDVRKSIEDKYICFVTPSPVAPDSVLDQNGTSASSHNVSADCVHRQDVTPNGFSTGEKDGDEIEIPEEFLDPLTCEVMSIPMLLPSGKNIDKSSLDRYTDSESSHGRHPRDPFTGVAFSDTIRPIPNGDLKARIDAFLMSNAHVESLALVPRTVGKGVSSGFLGKRKWHESKASHVSKLVNSKQDIKYSNTGNEAEVERKCLKKTENGKEGLTLNSSFETSTKMHMKRNVPHGHHSAHKESLPSTSTSMLHHSLDDNISKSHDDRLKDSLNSALASILATSSCKREEVKPKAYSDNGSCFQCDEVFGSGSVAYTTPCSHLICRKCLLANKDPQIKCARCGSNVKKQDVMRAH